MSTPQLRMLTVRQPWAWALIYGGKDVENRHNNLAGGWRGPVAIQASRAWDDVMFGRRLPEPLHGALLKARQEQPSHSALQQWLEDQRGHVIGVVDLVDAHDARYHASWARDLVAGWSPWAEKDAVHLVVARPRPLATPVPARGRLGLWTPDDALAAAIWAQVA